MKLVTKWSFSAINAAKRRTNPLQDESKSRYEWVIQSAWRSPNEAHDQILVMLIKTYHWYRSGGGGGEAPGGGGGTKRAARRGGGRARGAPRGGGDPP